MKDWKCSHAAAGCNYPESECINACVLSALTRHKKKELEMKVETIQQFDEETEAPPNSWRFAALEWLYKTEWVQERKDWPFIATGMHRADVIKKYIEHLEAQARPILRLSEDEINLIRMSTKHAPIGARENSGFLRPLDFAKAIMDAIEEKNRGKV